MQHAGHIRTDLSGISTWLPVMALNERRLLGKALHLHLMAASRSPFTWVRGSSPLRHVGVVQRAERISRARALSLLSLNRPHPISFILPLTTVSVSAAATASSSSTLSRQQQQQQHYPAVRHGVDASKWCHCTNRISPSGKHAENKALLLRGGRNTFAWRHPLPMKMSNADMVLNSTDRVVKCKCTFRPSFLPASFFCYQC